MITNSLLMTTDTTVASMRRTEALASVKFYQILSIFIFFIRLIILEDFIRLISYNGPCVRLGCSFFLATALTDHIDELREKLYQRIAVLSRIKRFLPLEQRKAYYNVMIKQTIMYASTVWSACSLGMCRGFFVSRSEVHALSLTPTRSQTVFNYL